MKSDFRNADKGNLLLSYRRCFKKVWQMLLEVFELFNRANQRITCNENLVGTLTEVILNKIIMIAYQEGELLKVFFNFSDPLINGRGIYGGYTPPLRFFFISDFVL